MSQILKSLQLITQSYTNTPVTGTGALYASGSTMYFENATGTIFPLGSSGDGGYIIIREYTGSTTWFKPDNLRHIQVICVGAGGGGGQGAQGTAAINRIHGGAGGGGGAIAWGFFDASVLTQSSYNISIGNGGAGGSSSTVTGGAGGVRGENGFFGQYTTFGETLVSASGGRGGNGGAPTTGSLGGAGGLGINCLPGPGFAINGGSGSNNTTSPTVAPIAPTFFSSSNSTITIGANAFTSTAGGGAGAGIDTVGNLMSGSYGASGFEWNTLKSNNIITGNSGSANLVTGTVLLQFTSSVVSTVYGLGGGGNGSVTPTDYTTPGGIGGAYGAGGGGSAFYRGIIGARGPSGGSGSLGLCIVAEYY